MAAARVESVTRARRASVRGLDICGSKPRSQIRDLGHPHCFGDGICEEVGAFEEAAVGGLGAGEGVAAGLGDDDEALGAASAFGGGAAVAEGDKPFVFAAGA